MNSRWQRYQRLGKRFLLYLGLGVPAFLGAIALNALLVERLGAPPWLAYPVVILLQLKINFYFCSRFLFSELEPGKYWPAFRTFLAGAVIFRIVDWGLYVIWVYFELLPYLTAQLVNIALFSVVRFAFMSSVFSRASAPKPLPGASR